MDFANTMQLFKQTTMFLHLDEVLRKRLEKVVHFVKKNEKSWIWSKLATFWTNYHALRFRWTFRQTVAKTASFREKPRKLVDLAKTMQLFLTNYHVFVFRWTFQQKVAESGPIREKQRKIIDLANSLELFEQTTMSLHLHELFRRKLQKVPHFVKKHEKPSISPELLTFRANYHVLAFSWTIPKEVAKSCSIREKARKHRFAKTLQFFEQTTMSLHFDELIRKRLQKVPHFMKKHQKSSIWPKPSNFSNKLPCLCIWVNFSGKVAKSLHFVKKNEKKSIWPKPWNFSKKLPCLCISMNFSGKSCKKCLISWKSTENHRFGKNFQLFQQATMSWHFHELFSKKLQKVPHSVEKHEKSSISPKLCNFFEQTTMSLHFDQLFGKKLQKVPHFVRQHEKSSIWPKLCNFWNKLQCLFPFDELSRKKLQKVRRLVKKHEKSSILSTCNFARKLPCFDVSMNIAAKSCKSCSCRKRARKVINLAKSLQIFEQTLMFLHFDKFSRKKLPKVPRFVKKHEKSSIRPKLCNFSRKLPCFWISIKFSAKSYKKCLISWKSTKNRRFGENSQLFQQTTMFWRFGELFSEKLQKVPRFLRKL